MGGRDGFSLLIAFDTDEVEFARGFEAGRLYELIKSGEEVQQTIHASNTEMAIRLCEEDGREFHAHCHDDTWTELYVEAASHA